MNATDLEFLIVMGGALTLFVIATAGCYAVVIGHIAYQYRKRGYCWTESIIAAIDYLK